MNTKTKLQRLCYKKYKFILASFALILVSGGLLLLEGAGLTSNVLTFGSDKFLQLPSYDISNFSVDTIQRNHKKKFFPSTRYFPFMRSSAPEINDPAKQVGIYLTASTVSNPELVDMFFKQVKKSGSTSITFDVKGSYVYTDVNAPLAQEFGLVQPLYDLPAFVSRAKESGIYTIGRYIAVKDPLLAQKVPEGQVRHPITNRSVGTLWVDPSNETVLQYNKEILTELILSGIDEINFDYIRYGTESSKEAVGLTGQQKANNLEQFLAMARHVIDSNNSDTKLGVSTYAILGWNFEQNFESVGQDINRYAKYVDIISPMAYPSTFSLGGYYVSGKHPVSRNYYLVYKTLEGYKKLLDPEDVSKLRPWIQGYYMQPRGVQHQIQAVYDAGLCGFQLWEPNNNYHNFYSIYSKIERPIHCR